ncbi:MAG: hypothetical protein K2P76_01615 [Lachnospiraceae bacterium]|nr:hypothetical protein [Lachnospiraceae bacterium]
MTMRERIINGKLFTDECEGLPAERTAAKKKMKSFNESSPENPAARIEMLKEMLGKSENVWIEPPFYFCYGTHIYIGEGSYINFNCNFIDDIPENSVAAGSPCNVIRQIDERDSQYYFKDRIIDKADLEEEAKLRKNK